MRWEDLLNPNVLGTAMGAGTIVLAGGFALSSALQRRTKPTWAIASGFLIIGATFTTIGAFGFSDAAGLAWSQSAFTYGAPAFVAAVLGAISASIAERKSEKVWTPLRLIIAVPVIGLAALIGARSAIIEEQYSSGRFLDDPLSSGFVAIRDEYPLLWSKFEAELKQNDLLGRDDVGPIAAKFSQEQLPHFIRLASDEAIVEFDSAILEKLQFLADRDPAACLSLATGNAPSRLSDILTFELKLAESKALERLVRSTGKGNSGVAKQAEAERLIIDATIKLARSWPEGFYAFTQATASEISVESEKISCEGYIQLNRLFLMSGPAAYARYRRTELANRADVMMSDQANAELGLVTLYAEAAEMQRTLPLVVDDVTTMKKASFDGKTFQFVYELNEPIADPIKFRANMNDGVIYPLCEDPDTASVFELGGAYEFLYTDTQGIEFQFVINSAECSR